VSRTARALQVLLLLSLGACRCNEDQRGSSAESPDDLPGANARPRYFIVGRNGAQTIEKNPIMLLPGFGVSIVEQYQSGGELRGRSSQGREFAMRDLRPAQPSRFAGAQVGNGGLSFGWVTKNGASVYAQPDVSSKTVERQVRYARLGLVSPDGPQGFYRVGSGWMSKADFTVPRAVPRPLEVSGDEPWIDVELRTQTLVAYRGDRPVFATLVAAGVGADGTAFATPKGVHRVRAKLLATTMDNLEHTGVVPYSYEEVPFTQYIGRVALHGAFWHDQFGAPRSHGCINLSLADAEWLFGFTRPALPDGMKEIAATQKSPGTVVQVR
jgi:hypothetical protein